MIEVSIGLLVVGAILASIIIGIYNGIISRKNRVKRAWADVIAYERQKMKVIPELERGLKEYQKFEKDTLAQVTELRSSLNRLSGDTVNPSALQMVETLSKNLLAGLKVTFEAYPELKTSNLYQKWMKELTELQEQITAALAIFNRGVEDFNNGIQAFPANLVNANLNKEKPIDIFTDRAAQAEYEYQPNL
ncbi:MAG: LemA family protein [Parcubacteria group bacterium]|nr:LemA family protein [Parcubacteria group bacterium]